MTRAAAVMVVMIVGLRETCRRALKCLISALALSAGGSHGRDRLALSGSGQGFLTGTLIPMLAPM